MSNAFEDGREDDPQIQSERPVAQVVQIVLDPSFHFFNPIRLATEAIDLRPSGNARLDPVAMVIAGDHLLIEIVVFERMRPPATPAMRVSQNGHPRYWAMVIGRSKRQCGRICMNFIRLI